LYVSLGQGEARLYTKCKRERKGLAESDARVYVGRHGSGCWHFDAFPISHAGKDKQIGITKEAAPKKGRNEGKKCQEGGTVTTEAKRRDDNGIVLHEWTRSEPVH
jgi:hypothetical protein